MTSPSFLDACYIYIHFCRLTLLCFRCHRRVNHAQLEYFSRSMSTALNHQRVTNRQPLTVVPRIMASCVQVELAPHDVVEVEVASIGTLRNEIVEHR